MKILIVNTKREKEKVKKMDLSKTDRGYIVSKNEKRYFGFLVKKGDLDPERVFFHGTSLMDIRIKDLYVGMEVDFKSIHTEKGTEAVAVKVIKDIREADKNE